MTDNEAFNEALCVMRSNELLPDYCVNLLNQSKEALYKGTRNSVTRGKYSHQRVKRAFF